MNFKSSFNFVFILILGFAVWKVWNLGSQAGHENLSSAQAAAANLKNREPAQALSPVANANSPDSTLSPPQRHLQEMMETLSQYVKQDVPIRDLIAHLKEQEPVITRDQNPDTGEMVIVRTQKPLDGTRYFHAQYFSDEAGKGFVQHMSFEFQPGPEAMTQAALAVAKSFPNLGEPQTKRDDYLRWKLDEDHILWVKRMTAADLEDDPFNAYTAADEGTVRVAVELEIHHDDGVDHQETH